MNAWLWLQSKPGADRSAQVEPRLMHVRAQEAAFPHGHWVTEVDCLFTSGCCRVVITLPSTLLSTGLNTVSECPRMPGSCHSASAWGGKRQRAGLWVDLALGWRDVRHYLDLERPFGHLEIRCEMWNIIYTELSRENFLSSFIRRSGTQVATRKLCPGPYRRAAVQAPFRAGQNQCWWYRPSPSSLLFSSCSLFA